MDTDTGLEYLKRKNRELSREIQTDTRKIVLGEQLFDARRNKIYLLTMLLFFTLLNLVIFLGRYLGLFSPRVMGGLFILVFLTFTYILVSKYYQRQIGDFFDFIRGKGKHRKRKCKVYADDDDADGGFDGGADDTIVIGYDKTDATMNIAIV